MTPKTQAIYWDQTKTADYLGLSPRTLESWRLRGVGPRYRKFGRRVLYTITEVEAWAERQARQSTSDAGAAA